MARPRDWKRSPGRETSTGDWEDIWTCRGYTLSRRPVRSGAYSFIEPAARWTLTDPSGQWSLRYPHEHRGQNVKRALPRTWANKEIALFESGGGGGGPDRIRLRGWKKLEG